MSMRMLTVDDLQKFFSQGGENCVSIYVPRQESSLGEMVTGIRMMRLFRSVESLLKRSLGWSQVRALMKPLWEFRSEGLWRSVHGGFAIFHSPEVSGYVPIPEQVPELAIVADSFHFKPILKWIQSRNYAYVLSLHSNRVELLRLQDGKLESLESIGSPFDRRRRFELFTSARGWIRSTAEETPDLRSQKQRVRKFFRQVDQKLSKYLASERAPMILAGPHYLQTIYRLCSDYPYVCYEGVEGAFEPSHWGGLATRAAAIQQRLQEDEEKQCLEEYVSAQGGGRTVEDLATLAKLVVHGQVQRLFIAEDQKLWGVLDRKEGTVILHSSKRSTHDDDVLDDLAELVLRQGGRVSVLPSAKMPGGSAVAAILRWY